MSEHIMPPPPAGADPVTAAPILHASSSVSSSWHHHHGPAGSILAHDLTDPMHDASGDTTDHRHLLIYGRRQQRGRARYGPEVHDHPADDPSVQRPEQP